MYRIHLINRALGLLALAAILAMLLVACGDEEEPTAPAAAGQSAATNTVEAMMEEAIATPTPTPTVTPAPIPEPTPVVMGDCRDGMRLQPGEGCRYTGGGSPQANVVLSVQHDGAICREGGPAKQQILGATINMDSLRLCSSGGFERDDAFQSEIVAGANADGSWTFYESALSASAPRSTATAAPTNTPTPAPPLNVYESGQTIPDFPSGIPNVVRGGASLQIVGGNVVITMGNGGTVEYSHATYTCVSGEGCGIENGRVTTGTIRVADPSNVENPTPIPTAAATRAQSASDRAVLVALYHSTGGSSWDANTNWLSDRPIGEWHGVATNSNGRVIELYLSFNRLTGEIPPELGGLSNLTGLFLHGNQLTGEIPPELGRLSNLTLLVLYGNQLTGEIPPELGGLSNLTGLSLSGNQLTGEIPPELGGLSNLTLGLSLSGNQLTGEIPPELGGLSNLMELVLYGNQLTGEIPPELGGLSNLTRLDLGDNQLTGCIPEGLRDIAQNDLVSLNLPDCGAATPGPTATPKPTATTTPTPAPPLNVYESGQTIPDFPSGIPNVVRGGASLQIVGGNVVITMGNGGTVEYSHATYTCVSGEGCGIENGRVTAGTIRVTDPSNVESPTPTPAPTASTAPRVVQREGTDTELDVVFQDTFEAGETRAYDFQIRTKTPQGTWTSACDTVENTTGRAVRDVNVVQGFIGLEPGTVYEVRYRYTNSSRCGSGVPGEWSEIGEGPTSIGREQPSQVSPPDEPTFNIRMVGKRIQAETFFLDFVSAGRFSEDGHIPGRYSYSNTGPATGTLTQIYDGGQYGGSCTIQITFASATTGTLSYTCASRDQGQEMWSIVDIGMSPGPRVVQREGTDTELDVVFQDTFEAGEIRAYDFQIRTKTPQGIWTSACDTVENTTGRAVRDVNVVQGFIGLEPGTVYEVRYRYRNSSRCGSGVPGEWSEIGEGTTSGGVTGGSATRRRLDFSEGATTTRSIPENTPAGINVGSPVSAGGGSRDLGYTLGGPDANSFTILPATGQIRTREGVIYDYETKNRYTATVDVTDEDGGSDTIDVTIFIEDLVPACQPLLNIRTNHGDQQLILRWDPSSDRDGYARALGYETEIRLGDSGQWTDRRTFFGRNITGAVYANLDNEVGHQMRVRPINAEGSCEWSRPVWETATTDRAPKDSVEHFDRFGPQPVGALDRYFRFLTPERCRHTSNGQTLDAACEFENTGPHTGRIFLEFDDPSQGSCEITLAFSSLTAGSFIDECFDAGVNTNVTFDRSFRMPLSGTDTESNIDVPRAPRSREEFDVLVWGRDDVIPGLQFGCQSISPGCPFNPGYAWQFGRSSETGRPTFLAYGEYTYENTGPSQGVLTYESDVGGIYVFTLDFVPSGHIRVTITDEEAEPFAWPGMPDIELELGEQPILLPIPPSWSAAITIESDFAPGTTEYIEDDRWRRLHATLVGPLIDYAICPPSSDCVPLNFKRDYLKLGRNRAILTVEFPARDPADFDALEEPERSEMKALNGSTFSFDLSFTAAGAAKYTLTFRREGHLPIITHGFVDSHGDSINLDGLPDELLLPDDPPQASGEDRSGVEIAAALTTSEIGGGNLQILLVEDPDFFPASYSPGDWLEPKDGSNQRMMIAGLNRTVAAASSSRTTREVTGIPGDFSLPASSTPAVAVAYYREGRNIPTLLSSVMTNGVGGHRSGTVYRFSQSEPAITQLLVVCMQKDHDIPTRGARYFSQPKTAEGPVQTCQRNCALNVTENIQECVWKCEKNAVDN